MRAEWIKFAKKNCKLDRFYKQQNIFTSIETD